MARTVKVFFFKFEIFVVRFGTNVPKDIKMGGVAIALPEKMVTTTRPPFHYPLHMIVSIFTSNITSRGAQMIPNDLARRATSDAVNIDLLGSLSGLDLTLT